MQLSDRLFQKKLLKERKILEKVQRTANKKEREYLFVEKLLQRVKVKILAFFVNKVIIITKWREVGKSREKHPSGGESF